ncbi:MAG TPA: pyridoxamine 5'-phosphate oxidase family protein [Acidimicrobiales bacterium]|nr:pyridoxamine 5'-phosphate oxidase family protein [Acidimicrobiales bacterium]
MSEATMENLSEDECRSLLASVKYGRVAVVTEDGRPEIFPVNFSLHGKTVVFVTGSYVLQQRAPLGHIAFEADSIDPVSHEGWDVVVSGEGADISDSIDLTSLVARRVRPEQWAPGHKDHWISIINPKFQGRRLYIPVASPTFY